MDLRSSLSRDVLDPIVRPRPDGLQLSYQFPHRVYGSKVFPFQSPNGSTVIIYGHDFGVRLLWRGGKNFKMQNPQPKDVEEKKPVNGVETSDSIMIIDSDDDEAAASAGAPQPEITLPEFEEDQEEFDPSRPFDKIIQHLDLKLAIKVLGVSVPSIPPGASRFLSSISPILSNMIVFSAICGDSSIRVIAVPLTPPPPGHTNDDYWKPQIISLGESSVQGLPTTAALTFTCQTFGAEETLKNHTRSSQAAPSSKDRWDILVAVHTSDASGKLSIYRVPITERKLHGNLYSLSMEPQFPIQQQYLNSPATKISFSPCQYPSDRHSQLLLAFSNGSVKVYSCLPKARLSGLDRKRSGAKSETAEGAGKWLVTLYTEIDQSPATIPRRKSIIDAKWALGGKGIIALLSSGEWGVWDIECSQTEATTQSKQNASLNSFAICGRVVPPERTTRRSDPPSQPPQFAPLTPSTRRIREEALFKGTPNSTQHATRGGICIVPSNQTWDQPADESVLLWHGTRNSYIPSLLSLRRSNVKAGLFSNNATGPRPAPIEHIHLLGEMQRGIEFFPLSKIRNKRGTTIRPTVLITAEHRLIVLTENPLVSMDDEKEPQTQANIQRDDQAMLQRGELDLMGMDRVLAGMAGGDLSLNRSMHGSSLFS